MNTARQGKDALAKTIDLQLVRLGTAQGVNVRALEKRLDNLSADRGPVRYLFACIDEAWDLFAKPQLLANKRTWLTALRERPKRIDVVGCPDELGGDEHEGAKVVFSEDYPRAVEKLLLDGVVMAMRPAAKGSKQHELLCAHRSKTTGAGHVYEITAKGAEQLGVDAAAFLTREVDGLLGVGPPKAKKSKRSRESSTVVATVDVQALARDLLGEPTLQGQTLGQPPTRREGFESNTVDNTEFYAREWQSAGVAQSVSVIVEAGRVRRVDAQLTLSCAGLEALGAQVKALVFEVLETRWGKPAKGNENKKGDGEWFWRPAFGHLRFRYGVMNGAADRTKKIVSKFVAVVFIASA
jgi:hypothetical protein